MKSTKKNVITITVFLLFVLIMLWMGNGNECKLYQEYKILAFRGVVLKKFVDPNNHSDPFVYIKCKGYTQNLDFSYDSIAYASIELGDTIMKKRNDPYMYINNGRKSLKTIMRFRCDTAAK